MAAHKICYLKGHRWRGFAASLTQQSEDQAGRVVSMAGYYEKTLSLANELVASLRRLIEQNRQIKKKNKRVIADIQQAMNEAQKRRSEKTLKRKSID